jgi:hypothetical protein
MVKAITAYLDFCYLVRRSYFTESTLDEVDEALARFHKYRCIFQETGVRASGSEGVSLPRSHAAAHYRELIELFGAPNGLCSSITEAKHIKAVKEHWRRSNRYKVLGQMLLTNQRLDKLAAARVDFSARGMLRGSCLGETYRSFLPTIHEEAEDAGGNYRDQHTGGAFEISDEDVDGSGPADRDVINEVFLAKTPREHDSSLSNFGSTHCQIQSVVMRPS